MSAFLDAARAWIAQDPDATTREELAAIVARAENGDAAAAADLADRFSTRLAFGTAGLRGALGAGPNRMNRVLVAQAAAGFAAYLRERSADGAPTVVVGYDGRRNSDVFARDSVEIFAGAGLHAVLLPRTLPTPVLAFAVRHLGATPASWSPRATTRPTTNGYKVYLGGEDEGAQIVSPADAEIAAHIQRVADDGDVTVLPRSVGYAQAGKTSSTPTSPRPPPSPPRPPEPRDSAGSTPRCTAWDGRRSRVCWMPRVPGAHARHGADRARRPLPHRGLPQPGGAGRDGPRVRDRPCVRRRAGHRQRPDADRLAVALPDPDAEGGWRRLTGNEIGLLLGWRAARAAAEARDAGSSASAPAGDDDRADGATDAGAPASLACSLVSSPGLQAVAEHYGLDFHSTLTGFKWISRAPGIVFGFEEALGYLVDPGIVRDKDGISAAVAMLGMAAEARGRGRTVADLLQEFRDTFGAFASDQISVRVSDVSEIAAMMASLRERPPVTVGAVAVARIDDLLAGVDGLPPGDVLRLWLEDGSRLIVRPSGTEPKLKLYLDVRASTAEDAHHRLDDVRAGAQELLAAVR